MKYKGAKHNDNCGHGVDCYVGTFTYVDIWRDDGETRYKEIIYDVYVFEQQTTGAEVCLRFGDEGPEYLSPGPIHQFLMSCQQSETYRRALDLLLKAGRFSWKRK